jgi:hypothetical protein
VRNFWFRATHCSHRCGRRGIGGGFRLSTDHLGGPAAIAGWGEQRYQESFIQHWLHRVIFFDISERVFTIVYLAFLLLVALSLWLVRPRWPGCANTRSR